MVLLQRGGSFSSLALQLASVVATASLVVSNKYVLRVLFDVPNSAAALLLVHNTATLIVSRTSHHCGGTVELKNKRAVNWRWMLAVTGIGVFSVFMSNIVLQITSVTFHQLSKLAAIPVSQAIECAFKTKHRSPQQLFLLALLCVGMYRSVGGETGGVDPSACVAAAAMVGATLAVAIIIRHICGNGKLTTAEYMYYVAPWGVASAATQLTYLTLHRSTTSGSSSSVKSVTTVFFSVLLPNVLLAILVQYLSTWVAGNVSVVVYAVLAQAKTVAAVGLSAVIFGDALSRRTVCGMITCLGAATTLSVINAHSTLPVDAGLGAPRWKRILRSAMLLLFLIVPLAYDAAHEDMGAWPWLRSSPAHVGNGGRSRSNATRDNQHCAHAEHIGCCSAPADNASDVIFIVVVRREHMQDTRTCGGCTVLFTLAEALHSLGVEVATLPNYHLNETGLLRKFEGIMANRSSKAVIVYPEGVRPLPLSKHIHVHWILSPIGGIFRGSLVDTWGKCDLVFNYGLFSPGTARVVKPSNLLQVLNDPAPDDAFQLDKYPALPRSGTVFSVRKAYLFHGDDWAFIHPANATELPRAATMNETIRAFLTHRYYVCYDPYSYLAWIAAMLGCTTIVHPLRGLTKQQWLMSSYLGGYLEYAGIDDVAGIAYGWNAAEIEHAEQTKHVVREEMFRVKAYAHSVTVPRFVRDAMRAANGAYGDFEGAMTVSELYPGHWWEDQVASAGPATRLSLNAKKYKHYRRHHEKIQKDKNATVDFQIAAKMRAAGRGHRHDVVH